MIDKINNIPIIGITLFSYLCGSISFAFLAGKLKGIDLREHGSKNVGATNAGRVLGRHFFFIVFFLDVLKGFIPTFIAGQILFQKDISPQASFALWLLVGFAAIAGHNWPCFLKFKGGKGVSTSLGVTLAIYPYYTFPGLLGLACWIVLVKISGYVSLGSVIAAIAFLLGYITLLISLPTWKCSEQWPMIAFAILMTALLVGRHASNIVRLKDGTENKFSLKKGK